jgi:hypothetical protein
LINGSHTFIATSAALLNEVDEERKGTPITPTEGFEGWTLWTCSV